MKLSLVVVGIIDVRLRSHRNVKLLAVRRERQIARGVAAVSAFCAGKNLFNYDLRLTPRFHIATVIREADYGICVADINPLRIWSRRIKRDSKRLPESGRECASLLRPAVFRDSAKDFDFPLIHLG